MVEGSGGVEHGGTDEAQQRVAKSEAGPGGDEQKAVKTTAFDLQLNPANPGMSFHKLDKAKDKRFWSVRVNADIRLIVHRTDTSLLLCYVGHHDRARPARPRTDLKGSGTRPSARRRARSARGCYLCLRYKPSPMCPVRRYAPLLVP